MPLVKFRTSREPMFGTRWRHHNLEGCTPHVACSLHEVAVDEGLRHCTNNTGATHPAEGNQHCGSRIQGGNTLLNLLPT